MIRKNMKKNFTIKIFLMLFLIAAISFSPRINLGRIDSRALDLRLEDILMVAVAIFWFFSLLKRGNKIYVTPIVKPVILYLFIASVSTYLGILFWQTTPVKSLLCYFKEIQYFSKY